MLLINQAAPNKPAGYKEELLAAGEPVEKDGRLVALRFEDGVYHNLRAKYSPGASEYLVGARPPEPPKPTQKAPPPAGAGAALKALLKLIGITSSPTCRCNTRARIMDEQGLQWCRDNEELIAGASGWLSEEAAKRHLPYSAFAGKKLLKLAIYRGSKTPGARP
jgi:hypothetical protein